MDSSVVFDDAIIGEGATVIRSVIGAGSRVGNGSVISDSVVGDHADVGAGNELLNGVRIWPGVRLPARSVRFSSDS